VHRINLSKKDRIQKSFPLFPIISISFLFSYLDPLKFFYRTIQYRSGFSAMILRRKIHKPMSDSVRKIPMEGEDGDGFAEFFRKPQEYDPLASFPDPDSLLLRRKFSRKPFTLVPIVSVLPVSRFLEVLDGEDGWGMEIVHRAQDDREDCRPPDPSCLKSRGNKSCSSLRFKENKKGVTGNIYAPSRKFDDYCNLSDEALS